VFYDILRKTHNFALDMNWLPATVIPRRTRGARIPPTTRIFSEQYQY
jgi:hypothetical protein